MYTTPERTPHVIAKDLQEDLIKAGTTVSVQTQNKQGHRTSFLIKKHKRSRLEHSRKIMDRSVDVWESVLWSNETKLRLFGSMDQQDVWCKKGKACDKKDAVLTVKHGGGSVLLWGCFAGKLNVTGLHRFFGTPGLLEEECDALVG